MRAVLKRSISKGGAMSATGKISLVLGAILGFAGLPTIPAEASENATFECLAGPAQICYYGILRPPGRVQSFVVQGHQRLTISGLAPGNDVYWSPSITRFPLAWIYAGGPASVAKSAWSIAAPINKPAAMTAFG